jgi:hypothetical protein
MAEWLKALVLKVLDEPTNPVNTGLPPMFDIGVLLFGDSFDGKKDAKKLPSDLRKIRWQGFRSGVILMAEANR